MLTEREAFLSTEQKNNLEVELKIASFERTISKKRETLTYATAKLSEMTDQVEVVRGTLSKAAAEMAGRRDRVALQVRQGTRRVAPLVASRVDRPRQAQERRRRRHRVRVRAAERWREIVRPHARDPLLAAPRARELVDQQARVEARACGIRRLTNRLDRFSRRRNC